MRTSESIKQIAPALLAAQKQMTFAAKDSKNPHYKTKYAGLPQVIDAIKGPLNDNGITFLQTPSFFGIDDNKLVLVTRLQHESGEYIEDTATCPMPKQDPQGLGSAMTYLRRYSLAAICGLYQDDDDGETAKLDVEPQIKKIRIAENIEDLRIIWNEVYSLMQMDKTALRLLEAEKDKRKKELETE
jgi:hypothetical protein